MKKKWLIRFLWLLVFAVAAMIFWFSSQNGEDSMKTSGGFVTFFLNLLYPGFDGMNYRERQAIYAQMQVLVRKTAHFTEFAMLGVSLRLLFHVLALRWSILWAWIAGTLYACTDELHQMLLGTRTSSWKDVAIDSAGVFAGIMAVTLWLWLRRRKNAGRAGGA